MRLHKFLESSDVAAPNKPVTFRLVLRDKNDDVHMANARAVLVFVDEHQRQEALRDAASYLREQYKEHEIPRDRQEDEEAYQILFRALRDEDNAKVKFAQNVRELRSALMQPVATELYRDYAQFIEDEFPPSIDAEEFAALVEEAKKKSLAVLLSSGNSSKIRRALPGLVNHYVRFPMLTSSDGELAA